MTDMEGVAGVLNHDDWVMPAGRWYEKGQRFLTLEVNAAVEGLFAAGARAVVVADAHGAGGIDPEALDPRASVQRGFPDPWPFGLDASFQAVAWIGQHAKAGTSMAQIPHTEWFNVLDARLNGISVGEFGMLAFCAAYLGVPVLFGSGDQAFCEEALGLVPGIETVAVKRGLTPGSGSEMDTDAYRKRNLAAVHLQPQRARALIREGAERALRRLGREPSAFRPPVLEPPFLLETDYRVFGPTPAHRTVREHPSDVVRCLNAPQRTVGAG